MNRKGFTTVEVLVCFVIVSVVMMSLFSTISAFNEKKIQESYRSKVYEFKNQVTNMIQEDIIKRGLSYAKITDNKHAPGSSEGKKYTVDMTFRDGTKRQLIVYQRFTKTNYRVEGTTAANDLFYIEYGTPSEKDRYPLPNLGEAHGFYSDSTHTFVPSDDNDKCYRDNGTVVACSISQDFQINNIAISVSNEADPDVESHVLNIYIGFYHPNLGTKYAINIVAPIDFQTSTVDQSGTFPFKTAASYKGSNQYIYYRP